MKEGPWSPARVISYEIILLAARHGARNRALDRAWAAGIRSTQVVAGE